jgi:hypothetical protein
VLYGDCTKRVLQDDEPYQSLVKAVSIGVASVIRDASGKAVAAMFIGVQSHLTNEERTQRLADLVKIGARLISYHLGYEDREGSNPQH